MRSPAKLHAVLTPTTRRTLSATNKSTPGSSLLRVTTQNSCECTQIHCYVLADSTQFDVQLDRGQVGRPLDQALCEQRHQSKQVFSVEISRTVEDWKYVELLKVTRGSLGPKSRMRHLCGEIRVKDNELTLKGW